jgi:hypothetical protein
MEVSVRNDLCLMLISIIGFNVSLVGVKLLALYSECARIVYVDRAILESRSDLIEFLLSSRSSYVSVELCEFDRTGLKCSCPVGVECLALLY